MNSVASAEKFFAQVQELCQIVQEVYLARSAEMTEGAVSASAARSFTESLILCPTLEAARSCISRDLGGALSFVMALRGVQQRLVKKTMGISGELPEYHTRFYLLACAVQEYLDSLHAQPA